MREWANTFNLCGKSKDNPQLLVWMTGTVIGTLMHWAAQKESSMKWWGLPERSIGASLDQPEPFRIEVAGWALQSETLVEFEERALCRFHRQLKDYTEQRRREAEFGSKLVPIPS